MTSETSPSAYFRASEKRGGAGNSHLVSVRLDDQLIQQLALIGNNKNLTMSETIRMVLGQGLERLKWNH